MVVFLHIASELVDVGWFSFSIRAVSLLSQHHCWQPQKFSIFSMIFSLRVSTPGC